jgi:putative phosphoribosyl transferase
MFLNRNDAARKLARKLRGRKLLHPLVLAIPRGGVVTGAVLAQNLGAELDIVLSRKLRAPGQPEFAIGAISEDGQIYTNPQVTRDLGSSEDYLERERRHQLSEIARRKNLFRQIRPQAPIAGRSVIVTDDGIATGSTMIAALQVVRAQKPHEIIVAVPVAPADILEDIRRWCDHIVCLYAPREFSAIGEFYDDFSQVEDAEVMDLLRATAADSQTDHATV